MNILEKILEEIKEAKEVSRPQSVTPFVRGIIIGLTTAEEIVRSRMNSGWIPVTERLPEKPVFGEDSYIVQQECIVEPFSAYWDGEKWSDSYEDAIKNIVAWMPLPEAYKGE